MSDGQLRPLDLRQVFATQPPPLDFVLPGLLGGTVGVLVSPGGTGKSMLVLESACSIATGTDLFGLWGEAPHAGRVVVLAVEDPADVLGRRVHAMGAGLGPEAVEAIADGVELLPAYGRGFTIATPTPNGPERSETMRRFTDYLARRAPRLVVFDTLNRCLGGISENDSGAMGAVMSHVEAMCREVGCAALIVHHANKLSMVSGSGAEQHAARGSSAITDNARWQANLSTMQRDEAEKRGIEGDGDRRRWVRLDLSKVNYGPPLAERWLERGEGGVLRGAAPPAKTAKGKRVGRRKGEDVDDSSIPW